MLYAILAYHEEGLIQALSEDEDVALMANLQAAHGRLGPRLGPAARLGATEIAATVRGKGLVTDGPFAETKETLGGFWVIEVGSLEEATAWAARCPAQDNEVIEIRRIQEMEDLSPEVQEVAKDFDLEGSGWSRV